MTTLRSVCSARPSVLEEAETSSEDTAPQKKAGVLAQLDAMYARLDERD